MIASMEETRLADLTKDEQDRRLVQRSYRLMERGLSVEDACALAGIESAFILEEGMTDEDARQFCDALAPSRRPKTLQARAFRLAVTYMPQDEIARRLDISRSYAGELIRRHHRLVKACDDSHLQHYVQPRPKGKERSR